MLALSIEILENNVLVKHSIKNSANYFNILLNMECDHKESSIFLIS